MGRLWQLPTQGCPCGYLGDPAHECRCGAGVIARYQKLARTIADLEGERGVATHHVAEAIQYRSRQVLA